jgi:hypothetical protein
MSLDFSAGSRAGLEDYPTGSSVLGVNPLLSFAASAPPGLFTIPGEGSINSPPQAVISWAHAASFRIVASISGEGESASWDEVINLGKQDERGDTESSTGDVILSQYQRWQYAIRSPDTTYSLPDATTRLRHFEEVGEAQDSLDLRIVRFGIPYKDLLVYYPVLDLWQIDIDLTLVASDGFVLGNQAVATTPTAASTGPFDTSFKMFGEDFPLITSDGATVSGEVTVESWLPMY